MSKSEFFYGKCQDRYSLEFGKINTFFAIKTNVTNLFKMQEIIKLKEISLRAVIITEFISYRKNWFSENVYEKTTTYEYEIKNLISEFGELDFVTQPHNYPKKIQKDVFLEKLKIATDPTTPLTTITQHTKCKKTDALKFIQSMKI